MRAGTPASMYRHVKYKIRQNATFTPSTRDVLPLTFDLGPYSTADFYYNFGFLWIQVTAIVSFLKGPIPSIS